MLRVDSMVLYGDGNSLQKKAHTTVCKSTWELAAGVRACTSIKFETGRTLPPVLKVVARMHRHKPLLLSTWWGCSIFSTVQSFTRTTRSYTLLLKLPVLMRSCGMLKCHTVRVSKLRYESVCIDSKTVVFTRAHTGEKETTNGWIVHVNFVKSVALFLEVVCLEIWACHGVNDHGPPK